MLKPLILFTGFFASGKTTRVRNLVSRLASHGIFSDVIINDFIDARIDASSMGDSASSVTEISAGCACCESIDELAGICKSTQKADGDLVLIEINGASDPLAILEALTLWEEHIPFSSRIQINLVDLRNWGRRGEWNPLEFNQMETATFWLPTHTDEVGGDRVDEVRQSILKIAPDSIELNSDSLLKLAERAVCGLPPKVGTRDSLAKRNFSSAHELSHQFGGCKFPLPSKVPRRAMEKLFSRLPESIIRAKAVVKLTDSPGKRWLFQRAGSKRLPEPVPIAETIPIPSSLLCISPRKIDQEEILHLLVQCFGDEAAQVGRK